MHRPVIFKPCHHFDVAAQADVRDKRLLFFLHQIANLRLSDDERSLDMRKNSVWPSNNPGYPNLVATIASDVSGVYRISSVVISPHTRSPQNATTDSSEVPIF